MPTDTTQANTPDKARDKGIDPATAMALIQSLAGAGSKGSGQNASDALARVISSQSDDPNAGMLASLLLNGFGEDADDQGAEDEDDAFAEIDRLLDFADHGFPTEASLADDAAPDADAELESLREVNDTLADALGACSQCWGGEDDCPVCGGDGAPGAMLPDLDLFNELILPAVRRVNSARHAGPKQAPQSKNDPAIKEMEDG